MYFDLEMSWSLGEGLESFSMELIESEVYWSSEVGEEISCLEFKAGDLLIPDMLELRMGLETFRL